MAAPMFPANAHRFDPYPTFKFQVLIDGQPVAGLRKTGALKKATEVVGWRTAGDPSHERKLPGGTTYEAVTFEQGLTHDPVFEQWANLVNNIDGDAARSAGRGAGLFREGEHDGGETMERPGDAAQHHSGIPRGHARSRPGRLPGHPPALGRSPARRA